MLEKLINDLKKSANTNDAILKQRYFKTLSNNDVFIGISNPAVQTICKKYEKQLTLSDLSVLLSDPIHEFRYGALILLERLYARSKDPFERQNIVQFYLDHADYVDNWDLVDCSCYKILGHHTYQTQNASILDALIASDSIWKKRIAVISTMFHVKNNYFNHAFRYIEILLDHPHDLIHKAYGWMLREIWTRGGSEPVEEFLREHYNKIHRTALRYAIEKMPEKQRQIFLKGNFD